MSKYTDAIKEAQFQIANAQVFLESEDYKNEPAIQWSAKRKLRDFTIYLEALQIADRLEQADARENVGKHLGEMEEWKRLTTNEDSYFNGYNQALADIRGDNK